MTHPQHQPTEPERPVSDAERTVARRRIQTREASERQWWDEVAPKLLREAVAENVSDEDAERILSAARDRDWYTAGALLWAAVEPYLDDACVKAHDPEA